MSSASTTANAGAPRIEIAILTYGSKPVDALSSLLSTPVFASVVNVRVGDLGARNGVSCHIAIAMVSPGDDIKQYLSDVAYLRLVRKIPVVFAVVHEKMKNDFAQFKDEVATDDVVSLPMSDAELTKLFMTHLVSLQLDATAGSASPSDAKGQAQSFGEILVQHDIITPLQLKKALDYQNTTGHRLGDALVELGCIDEDQKMHFLASQLGVQLATAKQYASADLSVVSLIPERIARRHVCLALEKDDRELTVVMVDVLDLRLLDSLRDLIDLRITPVLGKKEDIAATVERYYRDISSHNEASNLMPDQGQDLEYLRDREDEQNLEEIAAAGAEVGVIKLVNLLIANAVKDHASDIHIEPLEKDLVVRYRIDGDLRKVMSPPKRTHQAIITRVKILSNLDIAERRLPQDGRMVVRMTGREVDIRVSVLPTIFGEKVVLRILDKEAFERSVSNLGFTPYEQAIFKSQVTKPYGMIISTGPTGSGKSTTLYSAVQVIKNITRNIVTVEDPVEFHMEGVNQVHVNTKIGYTFSTALRSILRQDPDIVLIGEIRDAETADIAIKMALTGHLVLSTLHTNDAASAIARFVDIGIPPLLLGSSLNVIIAQRLVRRICAKCRTQYEPAQELLDQLRMSPRSDLKFYLGEGCVSCNGTGYSGRTGIFEMLVVTKAVRKLILRNAPTMEIQDLALKEGMRNLRQSGIELALQGGTTIEQVIAVTTETEI